MMRSAAAIFSIEGSTLILSWPGLKLAAGVATPASPPPLGGAAATLAGAGAGATTCRG